MDVSVLAVGRLKAGPESELCTSYLERAQAAGRGLGLRGFQVKEFPESRAARTADRIAQEEEALVAALERGGRSICLDERGDLVDSETFAAEIGRAAAAAAPRIAFVIGGPDGLGDRVRGLSDRRISFGRVTWPHRLVRVLLAEQLYRATTILSGHPYHRA
jgi:23S rRNA (pseudouridine1915-N3)-methyltransferase